MEIRIAVGASCLALTTAPPCRTISRDAAKFVLGLRRRRADSPHPSRTGRRSEVVLRRLSFMAFPHISHFSYVDQSARVYRTGSISTALKIAKGGARSPPTRDEKKFEHNLQGVPLGVPRRLV